jgi:anti-sigma B factor antagonist
MDLDLNVRKDGDHSVLEVAGEIDVYTAPKLREQLIELKRVRNHDGSLQLVCTQEKILKIFRITGLTKVFPIHSSVGDAISAPTE